MELANMLIYHGTELTQAADSDAVRIINGKVLHEAKKLINRLDPPKKRKKPKKDLKSIKEWPSA